MYYEHDDDSFLRQIDFESYQSDVDWLKGIVDEVVPMTESLEITCWLADSETAECGVEGGRFDKPVYENDPDELFAVIKQAYPELNWEV